MAVHKICRQGYWIGYCPDEAMHDDINVHVVACHAEHKHVEPYPRAAQVLQLRGLPVPAHLRAALVDAEQVAGALEAEAKAIGGLWGEALEHAAGVVRKMAPTTP